MWRPENWDEIKQAILPLRMESLDPEPFKLIEAGADAMLQTLREGGITMSNYNPVNRTVMETASFLNQCKDGTLVFIPEEAE